MASMNPKPALRTEAIARRAALAGACPGFAQRIAAYTDELAVPRGAVVSFYWPMGDEADPRALAQALAVRGAALALPALVAKGAPLTFREWREGDSLVAHSFGMLEPGPEAPEIVPDVLLVPLLAFDSRGHRLGYGGGFYDRTLADLPGRRTVGCAFAAQEVEAVPAEPHDHTLDAIATEAGVILLEQNRLAR